jgi:hypothetical protein
MSLANKYFTWILLAVFGYILTPAALLHEFQGHEDTKCIPGTSAIENQHIHCKLLQIEGQTYTPPQPVILASLPWSVTPGRKPQPEAQSGAVCLFTNPRAPPRG